MGYDFEVEHSGGRSCYVYSGVDEELNFEEFEENCSEKGGRLLDLTSKIELLDLVVYLNSSVWLSAFKASGGAFRWSWIKAQSDNVSESRLSGNRGEFVFSAGSRNRSMSWINQNNTADPEIESFVDDSTGRKNICLIGKAKVMPDGEKYIDVHEVNCEKFGLKQSVCEKTLSESASFRTESYGETYAFTDSSELTETTISGSNQTTSADSSNLCVTSRRKRDDQLIPNIDLYLNPNREAEREQIFKKQKKAYQDKFASMDSINSFSSMFELLWYSGNPCFDVAKLTSDRLHEKSVIKQCIWKGDHKLLTSVPTDTH